MYGMHINAWGILRKGAMPYATPATYPPALETGLLRTEFARLATLAYFHHTTEFSRLCVFICSYKQPFSYAGLEIINT
jgi:hypothetical protein